MREEVIVKSEEVWRVFGKPENLFIFSREAKRLYAHLLSLLRNSALLINCLSDIKKGFRLAENPQ